jgi:hypothetical protein
LNFERNTIREKIHNGCCPCEGEKQRERRRLPAVMMVMMMVVTGPGGERGTCEHHQE